MQIRFSQLKDALSKPNIGPMLVSGDEPYQHMLACDMYRKHAKDLGYTERKVLTVETGFDWLELEQELNNMSLFGDRTLIDLRIPNGKPGATGSKAIVNFLENIHEDVQLLVQVPRLDRSAINSAWVKALDRSGSILRVWPLNETDTRRWIQQKLQVKKLNASNKIVDFITQQVEGNLLAAMQEIEKIALVSESKKLDENNIHEILSNSSHYSLNELMDVVVKGDIPRIIRIIEGLKKEDVAPPLLLWGLTEQIRKIVENKSNVFSSKSHIGDIQQFTALHQNSTDVLTDKDRMKVTDLLKQCARVDRVIKGRAGGDAWRELLQLSLATRVSI